MAMNGPHKVCPNCGICTALSAAVCTQCGHTFSTQFQPADQTQAWAPIPPLGSSQGSTSAQYVQPIAPDIYSRRDPFVTTGKTVAGIVLTLITFSIFYSMIKGCEAGSNSTGLIRGMKIYEVRGVLGQPLGQDCSERLCSTRYEKDGRAVIVHWDRSTGVVEAWTVQED